MKTKTISITFFILTAFIFYSCKNKLDIKPDSQLVVPSTAEDLQAILEYSTFMNKTPALAQLSADEYFITNLQSYQSISNTTPRNAYLWKKDIFEGETQIRDWTVPYSAIYNCNNVLDILSHQDLTNDDAKQIIKGWALFVRAYTYYTLASIYSKAYDSGTANSDLGLPLKLTAGIDEIPKRSSLQETYDQIIKDALESSELLNTDIIVDKRNRPSKVAAFALLSRVYLSMRKYDLAELYADKSLALYSKLIDFNSLSTTASSAFTYNSVETIYFTHQWSEYAPPTFTNSTVYGVDTNLIKLYDPNDLRLKVYFRQNSTTGYYTPKAINSLALYPFTGLATDEMYLIKAECLARRQQLTDAINYLNILIKTRMKSGFFLTTATQNSTEVLEKILTERRKALVWRSTRWTDLKRLNLEGRNIILVRNLAGTVYTLEPNSPLYVLPIPTDEISLSGIQQNVR